MSQPPPIRNVSDTARWAAIHRAIETERSDALFRDPFARKLAGARGEQILRDMPPTGDWAWPIRTFLFDRAVLGAVKEGFDTVVNLAAGLDARPYRLQLPRDLHWFEVDLPGILAEKEELLRSEKPICQVERVPIDLADSGARQELFVRLGQSARRALILTEGLLMYLETEAVRSLAQNLAAQRSFRRWVLELSSPGLLRLLQRTLGNKLEQAKAPFKFAPPEGPSFFEPAGWKAKEVHSMLKTAAKLRRLDFKMRLLALLPESSGRQGSRPWGGVCVLDRAASPDGPS